MNKKLLLALMLLPLASAAFDTTGPGESPDEQLLEVTDPTVLIQTYRNFTVDAAGEAYVSLADTLPAGHFYEAYVSTDAGAFVKVTNTTAPGDASTDASPNFTVLDGAAYTLRFDLTIPATHVVGLLSVNWIIALEAESGAGGNGGVLDESFAHKLMLRVYDESTDSDADGLPDAWEDKHFGNLDQNGGNDPDGDGYNNAAEYEAGTDPDNAASHPEQEFAGAGVKVTDRQIGNFVGALFLYAALALVVFLVLPQRKEKKAGKIMGAVGVSLVAATAVVLFADAVSLTSARWAWWSYLGITWEVVTAFFVASAALTFAGAAFVFKHGSARKERRLGLATLAAVVVTGLILWVLHGSWGFDLDMNYLK